MLAYAPELADGTAAAPMAQPSAAADALKALLATVDRSALVRASVPQRLLGGDDSLLFEQDRAA